MEALLVTATLALVSNIPLGLWRAGTRKLSWQWFMAVHLAVPLIVAMRLGLGVSWTYVPLLIAMAALGQVLGSRLWREGRWPAK